MKIRSYEGSCVYKGKKTDAGRYLLCLSLLLNIVLLTSLLRQKREAGGERGMAATEQICLQRTEKNAAVGTEGNGWICKTEMMKSGKSNNSNARSCSSVLPENPTVKLPSDAIINLDHGDPKMFESFWKRMGDKCGLFIPGWQFMSYFSNNAQSVCWFLEPSLEEQVLRLHRLVGNANVEGRHVVIGTGSTQLFQAALYALSPADPSQPVSVVSAAPYYSSYPIVTDLLKSGIYKWAGDAYAFNEIPDLKRSPYIELVTSPNNPDGFKRDVVVHGNDGKAIYDLAYYWPQYTPITSAVDADVMLFTASKSTGHAGTRIGWALVKDKEVARKMTKFIELNTIGVSKDSQARTAKILSVISDGYENEGTPESERFFSYSKTLMQQRWEALRAAVKIRGRFSLPDFPSEFCSFFGKESSSYPAFAWAKCEFEVDDCAEYLKANGILTRSGKHFGVPSKYSRISMLDRDGAFQLFVERMSKI